MSDELLKQLGARARTRDAGVRHIEASLIEGARVADAEQILSALDAQRSAELASPSAPRAAAMRRANATRTTLRWVAGAGATLAAAAAIVLAIRVGPRGDGAPVDYTVSVNGRVETTRSVHSVGKATLEARDDSMQEVVVRPRDAVRTKLVASVLVVRGGARIATDLAPEVSDLGAVRVDVPGPILRDATELIVVLTSPESARAAEEIRIPVEAAAKKD